MRSKVNLSCEGRVFWHADLLLQRCTVDQEVGPCPGSRRWAAAGHGSRAPGAGSPLLLRFLPGHLPAALAGIIGSPHVALPLLRCAVVTIDGDKLQKFAHACGNLRVQYPLRFTSECSIILGAWPVRIWVTVRI